MEFTIANTLILANEISLLPSASHVLIKSVGKDKLSITGTDNEVSLQMQVDAEIKKEGSICVLTKKLLDILKTLKAEVHFKKDSNEWVQVKSGKSKFRLTGIGEEFVPEFKTLEKISVEIDSNTFHKMVKSTIFAITQEESRFALSGVKMEVSEGTARMVATDAHRLAFIEDKAKGNLDVLIPKNCLSQLLKLPKGDLLIGEDENHIFFQVDTYYLTSRKLSGSFPQYAPVLNQDVDKKITVKTSDLKDSIKRVSLMANEMGHAVKARIKKDELELFVVGESGEECEDVIEAEYEGEEVIVAFNWTFLTAFLDVVEEETVTINFKNATTALRIDSENRKYILVPLRI